MANLAELGPQVACSVCALGPLCKARSDTPAERSMVECRTRLAPGERLYRVGAPGDALYAVRAGFIKLEAPDGGGGQHLARFLMPGDVAGLDALGNGSYQSEAVSLEDTEVCRIPVWRVELLAEYHGRTRAHVRGLLARELAEARSHAVAIAHLSAARRVAGFLLELSRRWAERGYSPAEFRLPMQRREIGDYLGLTTETVSRMLSEFRTRGWVALPPHGIVILAAGELARVLSGELKLG
jgi:CRP/FNR family transcriptional regulator, anaerobic regulatory protein